MEVEDMNRALFDDDAEGKGNDVLSETELSQEILIDEIRKFVQNSVERRELRRSIRKKGRKLKEKLLLKDRETEAINAGPKATSRYCLSYFFEVIKNCRNCPRKRKLVSDIGFAELLELEECIVPRAFAQWLADGCSFDDDGGILIHNTILLNAHSVKDTFAIPSGEAVIDVQDEEGKVSFLAHFALTDVPSIKYFGTMAMHEDLPDDVFIRCFMAVNLGTFLCPTSSTKPSTKYLGSLVNVENIKSLNWCKLVHDWLACFLRKYMKDKLKGNKISLTLGGCLYHFAVRFLDFVDFGSIILPSTLPRVRVWKGDLIKHFSNMVIARAVSDDPYPIKEFSQTCYSKISNLEEKINFVIGNYYSQKVKEGICDCFQKHMIGHNHHTCSKVLDVLIDVLKCITNEGSQPGGTQIIQSSEEYENCYHTHDFQNGSKPQDSPRAASNKRNFDVGDNSTGSAASECNKRMKLTNSNTESRVKRHRKLDLNNGPVESMEENDVITSHVKESSVSKECIIGDKISIASISSEKVGIKSFAICEKSASLGHMIYGNESLKDSKAACSDAEPAKMDCQQMSGDLDDTNLLPEIGDNKFDGFVKPDGLFEKEKQSLASMDYKNNPASKIPSIACIAQQYGHSDSKGSMSTDNVVDFEELSKKYFFYEDGYPSFRLFDFLDDNGKTIDEPELFRPVNMKAADYANQIKEANCRALKGKFEEDETDICEESIQCAQKQMNENYMSHSPCIPVLQRENTINIDSDTPEEHVSSDWLLTSRNKQNYNTSSNTISKDDRSLFLKTGLIGRKLFSDTENNTTESISPEVKFIGERKMKSVDMSPDVQYIGERMITDVVASPEVLFMGATSKNSVQRSTELQLLPQTPGRDIALSPEVQCLGERLCNNMSDRTDGLYNAGLSLGKRSVSSGKENVRPKRVVNPSSYLCSPYEITSTSSFQSNKSFSEYEMKLYETITTLCDDPDYADTWVINMNNCKVSLKQLGCSTKFDGWVEAWLINGCCRKLFKDTHPRISQKHFFFHTSAEYFLEKWPNEYMRNIWQNNVINNFKAADSARRLHLSERLHFPALFNKHWFVFGVDLKARKFLFMDSLLGESSDLHREVDDRLITNFTKTWHECKLKDMHFETFGKLFPNLPKQKTPNDCGIFLIKYMERYCTRNPKSCSFSAKDVPEFRIKIALDTMFNNYNSAIPEMDFISNFDLESYKQNKMIQ